MWFCHSSMRCKRRTTRTTSSVSVSLNVSRQNVESSQLNLQRSFNHNPSPRSATQAVQVRQFTSIAQCPSCPTFASHNSVLRNAQNCPCSIIMRLANELTPSLQFLRHLRHWLFPSSISSPPFTRFSIFANSHLVHDLGCKTRKPTE